MESIIVSFLVPHKKIKYIVTRWRITRQGESNKCPGGWVIEGFCGVDFSLSWVGDRCSPEDLCSCSPVAVLRAVIVLSSGCPPCRDRAFQWLSSVPCSCAGAGRLTAAFWNIRRFRVSMESSGDMSPQCVCCGGLIKPCRDEPQGVPGQPVMRTCRWSSLVSRATVMSARDTRHNIYTVLSVNEYTPFESNILNNISMNRKTFSKMLTRLSLYNICLTYNMKVRLI